MVPPFDETGTSDSTLQATLAAEYTSVSRGNDQCDWRPLSFGQTFHCVGAEHRPQWLEIPACCIALNNRTSRYIDRPVNSLELSTISTLAGKNEGDPDPLR